MLSREVELLWNEQVCVKCKALWHDGLGTELQYRPIDGTVPAMCFLILPLIPSMSTYVGISID